MMNIQVTGRHIEITQAIHDYVMSRFERIERHFDHLTNVHVILEVEKKDHHAEATIHGAGHTDLFASAKAENMYAAIDLLSEKLDRQVIKHKEKLKEM